MSVRLVLLTLLLGGCAPALASSVPARQSAVTPEEPEVASATRNVARQRRIARLAPPFAAAASARKLARATETETALVTAP